MAMALVLSHLSLAVVIPCAHAAERPETSAPTSDTTEGTGPGDNGWGPDDEVAPSPEPVPSAPTPVVTPATVTAPPSPAVPTQEEFALRRRMKTGEGTAIAGYVFLGTGAVSLLLLAVPAIAAASVARDRAGDDPVLVSEMELLNRAERRERFAKITALAGLGGVVFGGVLIGAGLGTKSRAERDLNAISRDRQATLSPYLPRGGGLGLSVGGRF
jgi:hypothetical protein